MPPHVKKGRALKRTGREKWSLPVTVSTQLASQQWLQLACMPSKLVRPRVLRLVRNRPPPRKGWGRKAVAWVLSELVFGGKCTNRCLRNGREEK